MKIVIIFLLFCLGAFTYAQDYEQNLKQFNGKIVTSLLKTQDNMEGYVAWVLE